MARSRFALPVAGLNPADPDVAPGSDWSLTPRQRRELEAALRQAPQPAHVLRLVREGLQQGRPILRILEDVRAAGGRPARAGARGSAAHARAARRIAGGGQRSVTPTRVTSLPAWSLYRMTGTEGTLRA